MDSLFTWVLIIIVFYGIPTLIGWIVRNISRAIETSRYKKILYTIEPQITEFNFDKNYKMCDDITSVYERMNLDIKDKYSLFVEENLDEVLRKCIYLYNSGKAAKRKGRSTYYRRAWAGRF